MQMKAEDVVKILMACKESGAVELKWGGLSVKFYDPASSALASENMTTPIYDDSSVSRETTDQQETEPEAVDQEELKVQMLIDDPLALEEMVMRGDNQA